MLNINTKPRAATDMSADKSEILRGTLDLLVLKTLDTLGPMHG